LGCVRSGGPDNPRLFDEFESRTGKRMAVASFGSPWSMRGSYTTFPRLYVQRIRDRGTIPFVD
jgi:hypothetical protein